VSASADLRVYRLRVPLLVSVSGARTRDVTLVKGPAGWGEVSPLPGYPSGAPERAWAAAREAAVEGWPPPRRNRVRVNSLVPALDPTAAAALAATAVADGISCVKVKVGDPADVDRVAAVRDAIGPAIGLRVDANGVWDVETAVLRLHRMARYDLEFVEQPVATLEDLAVLRRRVAVLLAADESVRTSADAQRVRALGAADAVVLKVQALGGVRAAIDVAEAAGVPAVVSSLLETSVGIAAGAALAACLPDLPWACGLGTAALLASDVTTQPLVPVAGYLPVRSVNPDPALLERLALR
jgi:o-succinylbenzoate synthase